MPIVNIALRESNSVRHIIKGNAIKPGGRSTNVTLEDVREIKTGSSNSGAVIFDFSYAVNYDLKEPKGQKIAELKVKGEIFYIGSNEEIAEILKVWGKEKKLEPKILSIVLNAALNKGQVEAIEQAAKLGLPPPIPLPTLKPQQKPGKTSAS